MIKYNNNGTLTVIVCNAYKNMLCTVKLLNLGGVKILT